MTIHLPEDLARYVQNEVLCGHFASEQDAITEAVRLLRQRKQQTADQVKLLTEDELERQLVESGFLASTPPRPLATSARREFQPITIQGEPLSETVIRERR
jgi:Arc/MetJ-type ribon-helix-helix transcriptional regulator